MLTLGIETSCDDTALAILRDGRHIVAEVISSQIDDHSPFGGVVPELASRKHQEALLPLLSAMMTDSRIAPSDIDLIAVTSGPGLMGALLVGVMSAKALAQGWNRPIIGVNHLEGHLYANIVANPDISHPFVCLIVSGGHTELVLSRAPGDHILLGSTRDDAAGEAYDKAAKLLGLGYPGGPIIERTAAGGDPCAFRFPVALRTSKEIEFSFSGMKTAFRTEVERLRASGGDIPASDLCASYQAAITDQLLAKTALAVERTGVKKICVSGGVAANSALRAGLQSLGEHRGYDVYLPPQRFCTDNAVMIAAAGYDAFIRSGPSDISLAADPSWEIWSRPDAS